MIHILGKSIAVFSLVALLAICLACGGAGATPGSSGTPQNGTASNHDPGWSSAEIEGRVMAQDFVRENLRFPDDASFPWATTLIEFGDPERRDVWANGKVKAKNALGAELTYRFQIRMARDGKTWHPYHLVLDGETLIDRREDPEIMAILGIELVAVEVKQKDIEPDTGNLPTIEEAASSPSNRQPKALTGVVDFEKETERTWQSLDGKFSTTATLLKFDRDKSEVQLRKSDGSEIAVPIKTLSLNDRNYIRGQAREAE